MGHCLPHMSSGACCDACQPCRRQYPVCLSIETVEHQKLAFVPCGPSHIGSSFLCLSPASRHCLPPRPTVSHCCAGSSATLQQGTPHYRLKHSLQRPGSLRLPSYRQKTSLMSAHHTASTLRTMPSFALLLPVASCRPSLSACIAELLHGQPCCRGSFLRAHSACRLKASLERVQRMTHAYTELLLGVFPECVNALGRGLGIQQERIQVGS